MRQSLPFMVIGLDESLAVIAWNDRAERAFAVRSEDAIGRPIGELLPLRGGDLIALYGHTGEVNAAT